MYKMKVISPLFEGKPRVKQHQLVAKALKDELKDIHAYELKTMVPPTLE